MTRHHDLQLRRIASAGHGRTPASRRRRDDGGFSLIWFAVLLTVLMAMAGFGVDVWNWWYTGSHNQRAADAAALGGVVFLPGDQSRAEAIAQQVAQANDVPLSAVTVITPDDDPSLDANQLKVRVTTEPRSYFVNLLGINSATITRDATAEYSGRLPMGSPRPFLGRDPQRSTSPGDIYDPDFWLSVSGRNSTKIGGDRYAGTNCNGGSEPGAPGYLCANNSATNPEFTPDGYAFVVRMESAPTGNVVIEAYDPIHTDMDAQDCTNANRLNPAEFNANRAALITAYGADAALRYAPGDTIWCNGDVEGGAQTDNNTANVTTFIVRAADNTPASDLDSSPIANCTKQYRGVQIDADGASTNPSIYDRINPTSPQYQATAGQAFRRWVNICTVPYATALQWFNNGWKDIIIQVRSNADVGSPLTASTQPRIGRNHFALRAGYGTATSGNVSLFAQGRLPVHVGSSSGSSTEFYLSRITPGSAGRVLTLEFYDTGDASTAGTFTIVPPTGFGGSFNQCSFTKFGTASAAERAGIPLSASGCTLTGVNNANFNGRMTRVLIRIPTGYTCNLSNPLDCWIKVRFSFSGGSVSDHTTWDARLQGEPVRLIE